MAQDKKQTKIQSTEPSKMDANKQPKSESKITIDTLASYAKRRGFIFQSSEIYGGLSAVYDYAHYGALLKDNIHDAWKNEMIRRDDVKYLDSAIFMAPITWKASGHVDSFVEPEIDCRTCKNRMKADELLDPFGITDADRMQIDEINEHLNKLKAEDKLKCNKCGGKDLTEAKRFDLLVKSNLGSPTSALSEDTVVYLRGETCQGIYLNYKNYMQTMRVSLPFGIAQIGKAFRNEVVARQWVFRTREFEQVEMQYFLHPDQMDEKYNYWKEERMNWWKNVLGIDPERLHFKEHTKLAHYAKAAVDIEYQFKCLGDTFAEVEGIHQRGDWDLSRHQEYSKENLEYFDQTRNEKYLPNIMETSGGLTRMVLAVLDNGYTEETLKYGTTRIVMKINPALAPVKAAIFPLTKDEKLVKISQQIKAELQKSHVVEYDESGSIGKRYRRQDEIGTPMCITVDFDTLEDNSVTIRDRDTLKQVRVKIDDIVEEVNKRL